MKIGLRFRRYAVLILVPVLSLTMVSCGGDDGGDGGSSDEPIKIGLALNNAGIAASVYDAYKGQGMDYWMETVGKEEGILDRDVEFVERNTDGTAERASAAVRQLLQQDQVDVLVCCFFSSESAAIIPLLKTSQVLNANLSALIEARDPAQAPYTFSMQLTAAEQSTAAVKTGCEIGASSVGILAPTGAFGEAAVSGLRAEIEGGELCSQSIVSTEYYDEGAADFGAQVSNLQRADVDSAYVFSASEPDFITAISAFGEAGFLPNLIGTQAAASPKIAEAVSPEVLSHVYATGASDTLVVPTTPEIEEWAQGIQDFMDGELDPTSAGFAMGYALMQVVKAAAEGAGSLNADEMSKWLEANPVDTVVGTCNFTTENHSCLSVDDVVPLRPGTFKNGIADLAN